MQSVLTILGIIFILLVGLAQLVIGYEGIAYHLGEGWAFAALALSVVFRFTLPITIGAFFGATNVLDWHWALALLFVLPGILFIVPGFFLYLSETFKKS